MSIKFRSSPCYLSLRWPAEVTAAQVLAALSSLNGASTPRRRDSLTLMAVSFGRRIEHCLAVPEPRADAVRQQLEAAIPGLVVAPYDSPHSLPVERCWRAWLSTKERPLRNDNPEAIARGLLTALASVGDDELLVMRWVLGPVHRPAVARRSTVLADLNVPEWAAVAITGPEKDAAAMAALSAKIGSAGWKATLHIGVGAAGRGRQRHLLGTLAGAVRVAQNAGVQIGFRPARRSALDRLPWTRPLLVNLAELAGLIAWPIGTTGELPVVAQRGRLLPSPPSGTVDARRVVAQATHPGARHPLSLSPRDALHHLHVIGPTGTGKSTLLLNLVSQDIAAGRGVVVIEPRGDLVEEICQRIPEQRVDDVVVLDPTDDAPVGINPLAAEGMPVELKADHLLAIFKGLFADNWGPRTQDILTAGLQTLATTPGTSLGMLPMLFTDEQFRRGLVHRVRGSFALGPFWDWFENCSKDERNAALAPVMNKLRVFLVRDRLRRIVGQAEPRFDLRDIYRTRKILLVNLAQGPLGPEASSLLGALVFSQLWQTVQGRVGVEPEKRHPVMVYLDEFQNYLYLPTDLADVLAQARGLGIGLTLAHQHLAQLRSDVRAAVMHNARSRVMFATNHDDATILVRDDPRLTPVDVVRLGRYEVYASLLTDGESMSYASGVTLPPPPSAVGWSNDVRDRSREQYGVGAELIDTAMHSTMRMKSWVPDIPDHNGHAVPFTRRPKKRDR